MNEKVSGTIWDSISRAEEETEQSITDGKTLTPLPEVPQELLDKTRDACEKVIDFEIRCHCDPRHIKNHRFNIFQRIFYRLKKTLKS